MISISNSSTPRALEGLKSKKPFEKKKGLALRDITNQTPAAKTLKNKKQIKTVSKTVSKTLKKSENLKVFKDDHDVLQSEEKNVEYMPPPVKNPKEYTNDTYKMNITYIPTSRGCSYTKVKLIDDEFEVEDMVFNNVEQVDNDAQVTDDFLYF